ncbi:AbrB/MazE/SpoVT family DNA-binding domain-containing protein [Sandaracinobacteroides saxicola]|uniref:AbrB/MazE/SpoVT family DNA-binding domain-containing protein n=1 Tax=Sandaracinobacteroides saxicola TaxID=2759707 RepID=A0A7G5IHT2_9SPHN|nr:AbrB/MazE/SpoVT family DNA-binding domain-containing protein [Sandaracinobacteroides saxicola]QMW22924.1 AbrB/MazE/SpoVT family DNA-binding domain-containing protein [Sandaracinobacteroides saxicola]
MSTLTITSKGQITLKKDLLRQLGVTPGMKVEVTPTGPGRLEIRAQPERKGSFRDLYGILYDPNRPAMTLEEMDEIIRKGWAGEL